MCFFSLISLVVGGLLLNIDLLLYGLGVVLRLSGLHVGSLVVDYVFLDHGGLDRLWRGYHHSATGDCGVAGALGGNHDTHNDCNDDSEYDDGRDDGSDDDDSSGYLLHAGALAVVEVGGVQAGAVERVASETCSTITSTARGTCREGREAAVVATRAVAVVPRAFQRRGDFVSSNGVGGCIGIGGQGNDGQGQDECFVHVWRGG